MELMELDIANRSSTICVSGQLSHISHRGEAAFSVGSGCGVDHHERYIHGRHFRTTGFTWNKLHPNDSVLGLLCFVQLHVWTTICKVTSWLASGFRIADLQR